jgi:nucleoid-associated protein YgaU
MTDEDEKAPDFSDVAGGSSSTAPESGKTYTIAKGDTLSKIAHNEYGDSKLWRKIFEHNKNVIKDPDKIYPGQVITLPAKEDLLS